MSQPFDYTIWCLLGKPIEILELESFDHARRKIKSIYVLHESRDLSILYEFSTGTRAQFTFSEAREYITPYCKLRFKDQDA